MKDYKITIGLEIHVALKTKSKLFSTSSSEFNASEFSFFDMGMPGMMPILNKKPVEMALAFAYSINADVPKQSYFERKHYFYADLPLGYQITQQHQPIMIGGLVPIQLNGEIKNIIVEHAHLECDAAKSIHDKYNEYSAIDLARCATPLLEIVSTPCMHSPKEARLYAEEVCELVKFLDICDGKLEEGSFRVDASISLSKTEKLGTRVEIKNISSFGFLEDALNFEIERQYELLSSGKEVVMETRLFDESTIETKSMRKKESVHEYRYMPDPDIPCLVIEDELIKEVKEKYLLNYFDVKSKVFGLIKKLKIEVDLPLIEKILSKELRETTINLINSNFDEDKLVKGLRFLLFWATDVYQKLNKDKKLDWNVFIKLIEKNLPAKETKDALSIWLETNKNIEDCFPVLMDGNVLLDEIKIVLNEYPSEIQKYKEGQTKILQFLIGKVMSKFKGKITAQSAKEIIEKLI